MLVWGLGCGDTVPPSDAQSSSGVGMGGSIGGHGGSSQGGTAQGGAAQGGAAQGGAAQGGAAQGGSLGWDPQLLPLSSHHRFIDGAMFGGWGPHLGHLLRAQASGDSDEGLWFVDDYCAQPADQGTACNVNNNHTLGYFERADDVWHERHTVALPGTVQQNTASIANPDGEHLHSYGIDVASQQIHECNYSVKTGPLGCAALPFALGPNTNYIGAAIAPQGHRLVWWTTVVDGGGGSFHYIIDYGGGWNGPRSGPAAGYNDASYINIAFGGTSPNHFTLHGQLVAGVAPNWSFVGAVGSGDMSDDSAVSWSNSLAPANGVAAVSTNDVWTDPQSGDTHLVARMEDGAAGYYHRAAGGNWWTATFLQPAAFRARLLFADDASGGRLLLLYGQPNGLLGYRVAIASERPPGIPIPWEQLSQVDIPLPTDFGTVYAIYPESPAYQNAKSHGFEAALVGSTQQHQVLQLSFDPG